MFPLLDSVNRRPGCLRCNPDEKREGPVERNHVRVVELSEDFAEALLSWG